MGAAFFSIIGIILILGIPLLCSSYAKSKGRSPLKWFFIGLLLPGISSFILDFLPDLSETEN